MNLLFLDVDGVLNYAGGLLGRRNAVENDLRLKQAFSTEGERWSAASVDAACVERLNEIVNQTKARVVLSSLWRTMVTLPKMEEILRYHGFQHHLVGATPVIIGRHMGHGIVGSAGRGLEIDAWLRTMDFGSTPVRMVILDDDNDMDPWSHRLIQTDYEVGLTDEQAVKAINMLGRA